MNKEIGNKYSYHSYMTSIIYCQMKERNATLRLMIGFCLVEKKSTPEVPGVRICFICMSEPGERKGRVHTSSPLDT